MIQDVIHTNSHYLLVLGDCYFQICHDMVLEFKKAFY